MFKEHLEEYQKLANKCNEVIEENIEEWAKDYDRYIKKIEDNKDYKEDEEILKKLEQVNLSFYTSVSNENNNKPCTIIRYYGNEIGRLSNGQYKNTYEGKNEKNEQFIKRINEIGDDLDGVIEYIKTEPDIKGTPEHRLESMLLREFSKESNKMLSYIQPIQLNERFLQIPTVINGSALNDEKVEPKYSRPHGGIDILARTQERHIHNYITIIELKDKYEKSETPEKAIRQAIGYAVFIKNLIKYDIENGRRWLKNVFFEKDQKTSDYALNKLKFSACVMMPPREDNKEEYIKNLNDEPLVKINIGDGCELQLINVAVEFDGENITRIIPENFDF